MRGAAAGEFQGGFIQQEIVTAGKLRLSRAKYQQEVVASEIQALAQQYRVVNGVRVRFWDTLTAQQLVAVRRDLLRIAEDGQQTTEQLVNVGQANRPDLLQAQIEVRRARVGLRNAEQRYLGNWAQLTAVVGRPDLTPTSLAGQLDDPVPDWDKTLCELLTASPELQFAQAEVTRDQITVRRERVEPIPNVTVRGGTGYNFESRNTVAEAQVSIRLQIWDRNQGTIRQAQADLARAQANVTRVELSLRRRFADAATRYQTARESVDDYRTGTLPKAKEAYDLLLASFEKRRAAWPQVLVAARDYARFQVDYLEALHDLRQAEVEIKGLLLVDGLSTPPGPTPQGPRHPHPLLHRAVGVVEEGAVLVQGELVDERRPRLDRVLGQPVDPVHDVGHLQPVPVNGGRFRQLVVNGEADLVPSTVSMVGPGMLPLYPHTSNHMSGRNSRRRCRAWRWNSLTPPFISHFSFGTSGASTSIGGSPGLRRPGVSLPRSFAPPTGPALWPAWS